MSYCRCRKSFHLDLIAFASPISCDFMAVKTGRTVCRRNLFFHAVFNYGTKYSTRINGWRAILHSRPSHIQSTAQSTVLINNFSRDVFFGGDLRFSRRLFLGVTMMGPQIRERLMCKLTRTARKTYSVLQRLFLLTQGKKFLV